MIRALLVAMALFFATGANAYQFGGGGFVVGDSAFKTYGSYGIFNAPFRAAAMGYTRGADYWDNTKYTPGNLQSGVTISTQWPSLATGCTGSICGFNAIDFGHYDDTTVAVPITPRQISAITTLSLAITQSFSGTSSGYDNILDLFSTLAPNDNSNNLHELEILFHCQPGFCQNFANGATAVTTFTDSFGNAWILKHSGIINIAYISGFPDFTTGNIDVLQILQHFVSAGLMASTEYFNGCAVGTEPFNYDSSVTYSNVAFTYN